MNRFKSTVFRLCLFLPFCAPPAHADSQSDGTDTTKYYWQDGQLNNLGRLSNTSPDFEEQQRRARLGKDGDQYLAKIRDQMASQAAANAKEKAGLQFSGLLPTTPLEVTETPDGVQVTLHADQLFYDNSASIRNGAADILDRLRGLLQRETQRSVHLMIADRLDDSPAAVNIDAERSVVIAAALQFADHNNLFLQPN